MNFREYRRTANKPRLGGASLAALWCLCLSLQVISAGALVRQHKLSPFGGRGVFGQPKWGGFGIGRHSRPGGYSGPRDAVPLLVTTPKTTPSAPRILQFDTEDAAGPVAVNLVCSPVGMEVSFPSRWGLDSVSIQTRVGNSVSFELVRERPLSCRYRSSTQGSTITYTFPYQGCDVTQLNGVATAQLQFSPPSAESFNHQIKCQLDTQVIVVGETRCQLPSSERMACGDPQISPLDCRSEGCCYDPQDPQTPCYFGASTCTKLGQFVVVVSKNSTKPSLDLDSVSLPSSSGSQCKPVASSKGQLVFRFTVTDCGTTKTTDDRFLFYETLISASRVVLDGPRGKVTRDSKYRLTLRCQFGSVDEVSMNSSVFALPPPLPAVKQGLLRVELRIAKAPDFGSYYTPEEHPVVMALRSPVYSEVRVLGREDPGIALVLDDCWATPTSHSNDPVFWSLIKHGCPVSGNEGYLVWERAVLPSEDRPLSSLLRRFEVRTFVFLDEQGESPLSQELYLHCSTHLCQPSDTDNCKSSCNSRVFALYPETHPVRSQSHRGPSSLWHRIQSQALPTIACLRPLAL
ncbi:zona pellucida sperm-binding protein 4-like isoform X2 [Polyodon spathula]|uniref:zona pellucida sperm-binding protein 4-like isoform X2 n=1 Tax=Polyodon spathula TaxID=7913 RepID=UPI001B7F46BB|nr:zona pellucida sperm-binding protein 4-like isoform X2 [Polyodon spathula]